MRSLTAGEDKGLNQGCDSENIKAGINMIHVKGLDGARLQILPLLLPFLLYPLYAQPLA